MSTTRTYDVTGWDDRRIEFGDTVEDGWYHAKLSDVQEDYDTNALTFEYTILGGAFEGKKVRERHADPDQADTPNKQRFLAQKLFIRAKRLGLMPPEDQREGAHTIDWLQLIGKECYLKIATRTYEKSDGSTGKATEPMFDGIYPPDDERVPEPAKRHEPCGLDILSESDKAKAAAKEAAKGSKSAGKTNGSAARKKTATTAAAASAPAQTDFGDI